MELDRRVLWNEKEVDLKILFNTRGDVVDRVE